MQAHAPNTEAHSVGCGAAHRAHGWAGHGLQIGKRNHARVRTQATHAHACTRTYSQKGKSARNHPSKRRCAAPATASSAVTSSIHKACHVARSGLLIHPDAEQTPWHARTHARTHERTQARMLICTHKHALDIQNTYLTSTLPIYTRAREREREGGGGGERRR